MKKIVPILLTLVVMISLSACSNARKPKTNIAFTSAEMRSQINKDTTKLEKIVKKYGLKESRIMVMDESAKIYLGDKKIGLINSYRNNDYHLDVVFSYDKNNDKYTNPEIFVNYYVFTNTAKEAIDSPKNKNKIKLYKDIITTFTGETDLSEQLLDESYTELQELYDIDDFRKEDLSSGEVTLYNDTTGMSRKRKVTLGYNKEWKKKYAASWHTTEPMYTNTENK